MKMNMNLTQKELKKKLKYNPRTGIFTWITNDRFKGKKAGTLLISKGYIVICINGKRYYAHRLAWLYVTGKWPKEVIDHKNLKRNDNRFKNLREATNAENLRNGSISKNNTTGIKGIHKNKNGYMVRICIGTYKSLNKAAKIYKAAVKIYHGKFARFK